MAEATNTGTTTTDGGVSVTVLVAPAETDPEKLGDLSYLWGLFFLAAVAVFCMRELIKLFSIDHAD